MTKHFSLLLVEDSANDAELITRHLLKAGYDVRYERVETADQMRTALQKQSWDLIITDYSLLQFNAPSALGLLQESGLDIPLIIVSGRIGEDKAASPIRSGAQDFILRDNLSILGIAVKRSTQGAEGRRARRASEEALRESEEKYRELVENANSIIIKMDRNGLVTFCNEYALMFFGYTPDELLGKDVRILLPQTKSTRRSLGKMADDILRNPDNHIENINENLLKNGESVWISWRNKAIKDFHGNTIGNLAIGQDITRRKKAEDVLRESEQRFRSLFENSLDGMMITVADGRILSANARMCEMLGMSEEEIIRTGRDGIVVQDERLQACLEERARTGRFRGELTYRQKDGSLLPVELSSILFTDLDGTIKSGLVVRDITNRKKAEEELTRARDELEIRVQERTAEINRQAGLLGLVSDAIIVWDNNGRIVYWNYGAELIYGYTCGEAIGQHPRKLLRTIYPVSVEYLIETAKQNGCWEGELTQTRRDGTQIVVLSKWALRKGDTVGIDEIMEVNRDITFRKQIENNLRMASSYNRSLIEASLDPLVTIDPEGKITDVNMATEFVTGYSREHLIGTDFSNYFVDSKKAREGYEKGFKDAIVRDYELEIKHKDGSVIPVVYNASVYRDEEGKIVGVFAAARDITERKQTENELLDKSQALEELNVALKVLLEHRQNDQREFEETLTSNLKNRIIPYIEKLKRSGLDEGQIVLAEIIERSFSDIASPFLKKLVLKHPNFTPKEMEIISLIKDGRTTKEIAQLLHIGKRTVDSHRDNIRKKLRITEKRINLRSYFISLSDSHNT